MALNAAVVQLADFAFSGTYVIKMRGIREFVSLTRYFPTFFLSSSICLISSFQFHLQRCRFTLLSQLCSRPLSSCSSSRRHSFTGKFHQIIDLDLFLLFLLITRLDVMRSHCFSQTLHYFLFVFVEILGLDLVFILVVID